MILRNHSRIHTYKFPNAEWVRKSFLTKVEIFRNQYFFFLAFVIVYVYGSSKRNRKNSGNSTSNGILYPKNKYINVFADYNRAMSAYNISISICWLTFLWQQWAKKDKGKKQNGTLFFWNSLIIILAYFKISIRAFIFK